MINIAWHLGLGDAIVCAPIIARLALPGNDISVPAWKHNLVSVESFFIDFPNVHVRIVESDSGFDHVNGLRLGQYNTAKPRLKNESFVNWFYRQAGMSQKERIEYCPLHKASEMIYQSDIHADSFILIHEDKSREFEIDEGRLPKNVVKMWPGKDGSILKYASHLYEADQIHCIDSSFLHLAEALPTTGKLFYHKYARQHSEEYSFIKKWEVLS